MEQFIVSARKYRPQTFKDVVGQSAITNTLLNAIENNHLAQALLFTGPRGVGKTTCARILARKINQEGYDDPMLLLIIVLMIFVTLLIKLESHHKLENIRFTLWMRFTCYRKRLLMLS
jgi:replication-associated recombination protein RarA